MSKTNCLLPSRGFCLNLRVRTVKSLIAPALQKEYAEADARGKCGVRQAGP